MGLNVDFRTPHSCILRSFYPCSIIANLLAVVSIPTFCRTKSSKKAQHRQNQSLSSLLRNFASKISFVRRSFAGNYPLKATGVSNLATLCVSENLPLFSLSFCSRCLWFWQCCIFRRLALFKILQINSLLHCCALSFKTPPRLRGQREISVVCDDGRFISPKEYSTSGEQGRRGCLFLSLFLLCSSVGTESTDK